MENLLGGGLEGEAEKLGEDQLRQRSPEAANAFSSVSGRGGEESGDRESGGGDDDSDGDDNGGGSSDDDSSDDDDDS